jgi:hypothetical protein
MNTEELRKMTIMMNGLRNVDDEYTFFYDETNNIRKLRIIDADLNVSNPGNFVLAGLVHKGAAPNSNIDELFEILKLPDDVKELKLRSLGKGDALSLLRSERVRKILDWLIKADFYIHYFNLNVIYWSLTDIVDSVLANTRDRFFTINHMAVKSDLYKLVKNNIGTFLQVAGGFGFPNVGSGRSIEFLAWLTSFVKSNIGILDDDRSHLMNEFIKSMEDVVELPFLEDEIGGVLIKSFSAFYYRNLYLFSSSRHIFDKEESIERELGSFFKSENRNEHLYAFADSKGSREIQISDVIAGLLGKIFTLIRDSDDDQLEIIKSNLDKTQIDNLSLLAELIDQSDAVSNALIHMVASEDEFNKRNYFLHGISLHES